MPECLSPGPFDVERYEYSDPERLVALKQASEHLTAARIILHEIKECGLEDDVLMAHRPVKVKIRDQEAAHGT